jgi:hypothetical protein
MFSSTVSSAAETTSCASSERPWDTSQRGDGGSPRRMNKIVAPPNAPIRNRMRQPDANVGTSPRAMNGTTANPAYAAVVAQLV